MLSLFLILGYSISTESSSFNKQISTTVFNIHSATFGNVYSSSAIEVEAISTGVAASSRFHDRASDQS